MKPAFSLIELIMTVVIISIAFIGVPLIMENSARTIGWLQNSKAIYHGLAKMQIVRSKYWDENNLTNVLDVDCPRAGHYAGDDRRKCVNNLPSTVFMDGNDGNDIDDYDGEIDSDIEGLYTIGTSVQYIQYNDVGGEGNLSLETQVPNPTNIKEIVVKVSKQGASISTYKYYSGNIGISHPFIKDNP